jgi:A/G-specific adenine glycosylase
MRVVAAERADEAPDPAVLLAGTPARRHLPWRSAPGERADPYHVWLSEIMLQQTTVKAVGPYYMKFLARWPSVTALAEAPLDDVLKAWAGLGYYARARNLHACAQAVTSQHGGHFPDSEDGLRTLPGIGGYTAAAIAAIAFGRRAVAIDGNIERVIARLYAVETELPAAKAEIRARAETLVPQRRAGDFTQAMMDLGATICTPKTGLRHLPVAGRLHRPRPRRRRTFPQRRRRWRPNATGASFVVIRRSCAVRTRATGSGGMTGCRRPPGPMSWTRRTLAQSAAEANGGGFAGVVEHGFTHFPFRQPMLRGRRRRPTPGMRWVALAELHGERAERDAQGYAHAGLPALADQKP